MSELVLEKNESIPYNWIHTTIGEISSKIHYGYTTKSTKEKIGLKYLRITDIQNNSIKWEDVPSCQTLPKNLSEFLLRSNDLVFARTGATVGKSFLMKNPPESVFASYLIRIILSEKIYANYVNYFFKSSLYWNQIRSGSVGMAQPNFNATKLSKIKIPLPPLNEQKRIVAKIEELFSLLDSTLKSLTEIQIRVEQYRHSLIRWIFLGDFKQTFSFSSEWKQTTVGNVYKILGGGTPSTKNSKYWGGKIPWITSADICGIQDIRPRRTVTQIGVKNSATHIIPKNSILIVTRVGLGKVAISSEELCVNQDIQALVEHDSSIDPIFALYYLSEMVQIFKYQSRGTTINGVTKKQLFDLPFVVPSMEDQKKIVDFIEIQMTQLMVVEKTIKENFTKLNSMKNLILQQAFEGKLVPQDPNDEPAEILLEKIKQEKQKIISQSKRGKKNDK